MSHRFFLLARVLIFFIVGTIFAAAHPADPVLVRFTAPAEFEIVYPRMSAQAIQSDVQGCAEKPQGLKALYTCSDHWSANFYLAMPTMVIRTDGERHQSSVTDEIVLSSSQYTLGVDVVQTVIGGAAHVIRGADHLLIMLLIVGFGMSVGYSLLLLTGVHGWARIGYCCGCGRYIH